MKSILLTSTALVAFAGAAAADGHTSVSWGGEASAEYNSVTGYETAAEFTATGSATLDNGLTATAEVTIDAFAGTISAGSIVLSSDNASLTFGTGLDGAVFTAVGDDYAIGDDGEEGIAEGVVASYTMGETTLTVSAPMGAAVATDDIEVGVNTVAGGWAVGLGLTGAGEYAITAEGTVGGADLNFGFASNDEWDAGVSYTMGAVTVSASTDEADAWTVGAAYDAGDYNAGFEYNADETWEVTAGYAANGIAVDAAFNSADDFTIGATYDMGNGLVVGAGMEADESTYVFAEYDLGGGASAFIASTDAAAELGEVGPSERDIAAGTTVGVSFTF